MLQTRIRFTRELLESLFRNRVRDVEFARDGARVVIDDMSLQFLRGSTLKFIENLEGSYFSLDNPNATSSCGCGTSFAV